VVTVLSLGSEHEGHELEHFIHESAIPAFVAEAARETVKA
jgi:hypothetical protein